MSAPTIGEVVPSGVRPGEVDRGHSRRRTAASSPAVIGAVAAGALFLASSGVLFTRAGYGPFGDPARRGKPCVADRCPHNLRSCSPSVSPP